MGGTLGGLEMRRKGITQTFMYGLMVFVLLIISSILSMLLVVPLLMGTIALDGAGVWVVNLLAIVIEIYMLGWVFMRFKVTRKR